MSKKISELPQYSGINNPVGDLPISIAGTTYRISPNKLQGSGGGGGATNLDYIPSATDGTVTSDTGTDATVPLADGTNAGLFSATEKTKLASITAIFTTALKTAYDNAVTWITTNGTNVLNHLASTTNPHATTASQVGAYTTTQVDTLLAGINTNAVDKITVKLSQAINKGQAVYISSANGTNIIVSKASNASEATSSKTLGLLETTGATNDFVNVVTDGLLDGLNTSTATIGDPVWLGTNGDIIFGLTNKPVAPAHLVYIGVVSRVHATVGEIIVKVQNGFELKEIHDVLLTSVANNEGLFYDNATSLWKNKTINTVLGGTPVTGAGLTGQIAYFTANGSAIAGREIAEATTGAVISFATPQIYNSVASPSSSNLTENLTGAKIGVVQKIYHLSGTAPSFGTGSWVKLGSGTYSTTVLNVIFAEYVSTGRIEYWITQ